MCKRFAGRFSYPCSTLSSTTDSADLHYGAFQFLISASSSPHTPFLSRPPTSHHQKQFKTHVAQKQQSLHYSLHNSPSLAALLGSAAPRSPHFDISRKLPAWSTLRAPSPFLFPLRAPHSAEPTDTWPSSLNLHHAPLRLSRTITTITHHHDLTTSTTAPRPLRTSTTPTTTSVAILATYSKRIHPPITPRQTPALNVVVWGKVLSISLCSCIPRGCSLSGVSAYVLRCPTPYLCSLFRS